MTTLTADEREAQRAYGREHMRRASPAQIAANIREQATFDRLLATYADRHPTPATHALFWEADDGWHGELFIWRVGPCENLTGAKMALRDAMIVTAWDIAFGYKGEQP